MKHGARPEPGDYREVIIPIKIPRSLPAEISEPDCKRFMFDVGMKRKVYFIRIQIRSFSIYSPDRGRMG
jgi:hypothetical protein